MECEVCKTPASLKCTNCESVLYCSLEHQQDDWDSIHKDICNKLFDLRIQASSTVKETREIRKEYARLKKEIYNLARQRMEEYFIERKYNLIMPAVSQCLRWCPDIFGDNCKELIEPYSILSEICLEFDDFQQAIYAISFSEWIDQKTKHKSDSKSLAMLFRAKGRLSLAENKLLNAIYYFSEHIVYTCEVLGVNHIGTACSYYYLGDALYKKGDKEGSFSAFQRMVTLWEECLMVGVTIAWLQALQQNPNLDPPQIDTDHYQKAEGFRIMLMLTEWCSRMREVDGSASLLRLMFSSFHTAGMFYLLKKDLNKGRDCMHQSNLAGIQCYRDIIIDPIEKELKHVTEILEILNK